MSQIFFSTISLFSLALLPLLANAKPIRKPIDPKASMDKLFEGRAKQVNQLNAEIKADTDLTPEEEKELRANMTPLTLTPEQVRKDNEDAAKTPEDQMNKSPTEEAPSKSTNTSPSTPGPSSGGGVAVPGQADPNMIVFPGRKKK